MTNEGGGVYSPSHWANCPCCGGGDKRPEGAVECSWCRGVGKYGTPGATCEICNGKGWLHFPDTPNAKAVGLDAAGGQSRTSDGL